jgi:hypothetical protein
MTKNFSLYVDTVELQNVCFFIYVTSRIKRRKGEQRLREEVAVREHPREIEIV